MWWCCFYLSLSLSISVPPVRCERMYSLLPPVLCWARAKAGPAICQTAPFNTGSAPCTLLGSGRDAIYLAMCMVYSSLALVS